MNIEIKKGMENLIFGMTKSEIEKILGQPDKINTEELTDFVVYYYNRLYAKLKFHIKSQYKLKTIETYNIETNLFGQKIHNKTKQEIISLLRDNNISINLLELNDYYDFDTIFVNPLYMTFMFMFDKLVSVEFSEGKETQKNRGDDSL